VIAAVEVESVRAAELLRYALKNVFPILLCHFGRCS
jgi:hypothetical protein